MGAETGLGGVERSVEGGCWINMGAKTGLGDSWLFESNFSPLYALRWF